MLGLYSNIQSTPNMACYRIVEIQELHRKTACWYKHLIYNHFEGIELFRKFTEVGRGVLTIPDC
jgi:hypothetical protein